MKKVSLFCLMIFLAVILCGCKSDNIKLTEDESNAIAQYCAYLIMKYDNNKSADIKLLDKNDLQTKLDLIAEEESKNNPTPTITEVPAQATPIPDEPEQTADTSNISSEDTIPDNSEPVIAEIPESNAISISEVLEITDLSFEFKSIDITDSYLNTGEYFALSAPSGKTMAVIKFSISNTSDKDIKFDATSIKVNYILNTNNGKNHEPEISLLSDDIQFYNDLIKANSQAEGTLIFFIDPNEVPLYLKVNGQKTFIINFN